MKGMRHAKAVLMTIALCGSSAVGQTSVTNAPTTTNAPSKFRSAEDGWLDVSGFLDEKYGFLPIAIPVTSVSEIAPIAEAAARLTPQFVQWVCDSSFWTPHSGQETPSRDVARIAAPFATA